MTGDMGWVEVIASLSLVGVAIAVSIWKELRFERSIAWASFRAGIQLLAVGLLFSFIFESAQALVWAWAWVIGMTVLSAEVVATRTRQIPRLRLYALGALAGAVGVTLALLFGLGVFPLAPVTLVVIAGITLGNTLPAAVQAADTVTTEFIDHRNRVEALLALGFDRQGASRVVTSSAVRNALLPQIERTKVIGLIALPGTMTGMLLAGAEPVSAVLVQLVITYLVLGSVGVASAVIVTMVASRAFTRDLRLEVWVTDPK
ncbi:MAG: ABC transporter permease [Acidimicrobiia bacterium]